MSPIVDETRQALDTAPASKTADSGLGNAINFVVKNLALAVTLAPFS